MTVTKKDESNFRSAFYSFLKNDHHTFVVQKTEKLASALYVVTSFVPSEDPLKTRLRLCALDLVSVSTDPEKAREMRYHEGFGARCLEIGSILTLAQRAGFISSMNVRILCDEYAELASFVKNHRDKVFGAKVVEVEQEVPSLHIVPMDEQKEIDVKDNNKYIGHHKKTPNTIRHINRKDKILSLFENKESITIKDASKAIEGCSEKTIQRELTTLVKEGILTKEGDKRWSTYKKTI